MSFTQEHPDVTESSADVLDLYGRCKALTLAAGATLLLRRHDPSLRADALALADEALAVPASSERRRAQVAGVRDAALALVALMEEDGDQGPIAIERARDAQRAMRAQLGTLIAAQYAPCGTHAQVQETPDA